MTITNVSNAPVNASDKRIILAKTDVLQLFPLKYEWAWDYYLASQQNHWTPNDIAMAKDIADWADPNLPITYRHRFETVFAQLTTFDLQRGIDLSEALMPIIDAPEIKIFLMRQAEEESRHGWSYQYCIENMGMDPSMIYNMYRQVPVLYNRVQFAAQFTRLIEDLSQEKLATTEGKVEFFVAITFWYLMFEGVWFALNLAGPVRSMSRQNRFTATSEQFEYILRDENVHINFGVDLINAFKREYAEIWTQNTVDRIKEIFHQSIELERDFMQYALKHPSVDYSIEDHMEMAYWYTNRRLNSIGIQEELFPHARCSMPWISEVVELRKESNFFETRVKEYQLGAFDKTEILSGLNVESPVDDHHNL